MALTAAQIVTLACQDAKCPGFVAQGGQFLNASLQDLCQNYDLDAALGTFIFTFNSVTGNGSGPYTLPADFLRTQVKDGKDEFFYTINGVPYPLIQVTKAEYDWLVQTPGFSSYPYNYATDLSQTPAQLFVWPPASGGYPCTMRYYKLMPDIVTPETSATVPWFKNTMILQRDVAGRLMGLTGDSRQAEYLGDDEQRYPLGVGTLLNKYLKNVEDREGAVHTVGRDRRRWGRPFDQLKNTKNIGWAIAATLMFLFASSDGYAQKTKAQIDTEITTQLIDNTSGAITPAILRGITSDIVNSIMPTAPVVSGHAAVFDGTTGLLKDLGSSIVPGAALAGNIAFFTDTTGLSLGASAIYQTSNPGNAALYSAIGDPTAAYVTLFNAFQVCQGTCVPATQQFGANNIPIRQGGVFTTAIPVGEVTVQAHGAGGYCLTNMPNGTFTNFSGTYSTGNCVGLHGWGGTTVANANIFGGNLIASNSNGDQNSLGHNVNYMAALELDVLVWQLSPGVDPTCNQGHCYGLTIAGSSNLAAMIANSAGIIIDRMSVQTNIPFNFGFLTYPGATVYAVVAGPSATGASKDSSWFGFQYADGGSTPQIGGRIKTDIGANLVLQSGASAVVSLQDAVGTSLLNASLSFGASKIRISACTVAGMLTNDVTTGQVNCGVTTLPSGLTAPALTVTSSFTATGLVTNADLVNASVTVNSQTCTLGSTCTIVAAATAITVGTTTINSGTTTRVLFDNAGVLGEYTISGTGNVAMTTNAVFTTPNLGTPSAITLTNGTGLPTTGLTGTLQAAQEPAHTGDVTNTAGSLALSIAANAVTLAKLATQATNTVLGNATAGTAVPTALAVGTCSTSGSALNWTTNTGFGCNTSINAATLGSATFAAPGAIGGGTPSTGAFTTVTASTSISSPIHAASGALTFQSNGSTFAGDITTGQQWYIGTTLNAPGSGVQLTVSKNAAAPAVAAIAGTIADFVQVDATAARLAIRGFGAGAAGPAMVYYAAGGTAVSPTQTLANDAIGINFGFGYGSGAYRTGAGSGFQMIALENCSSTACGSDFEIITTAAITASQSVVAYFKQGFSVGTATDPGVGKISALNGFVANATAGISRTCTIAVGNVITFTLGILTATSGVAGCV